MKQLKEHKEQVVHFRVSKTEYLDIQNAADRRHFDSVAAYLRALVREDKGKILHMVKE